MNENDSKDNNENQSAIIFGVMRQNDNCVFNPSNALCGSIAFRNLASIEEALAICEQLNWTISWDDELQADFSHPIEGESFIPIVLIDGNWYEIRGEENLPYRVNEFARGEWFIDGLWSVETPLTPSTQILKLGETRQVSELGDQFVLVTSDHEIGDILEGVGYKPSSSDEGIPSFDEIPSSSIFVLSEDGAWKEVWGCYKLVPHKESCAELIWHDNMSDEELKVFEGRNPAPIPPSPTTEPESEEEIWNAYESAQQEKKDALIEEEYNKFVDGDTDVMLEIKNNAWEYTPEETETTPSKLLLIKEEKFDAPIDSDENDWHIESVKSYVFGEKRED